MIVYYEKAKLMTFQPQLTLWWVQGRHNFSNRWDSSFRHFPRCNFLGKDASLTACCWLPLWGKKKTQMIDILITSFLFSISLY